MRQSRFKARRLTGATLRTEPIGPTLFCLMLAIILLALAYGLAVEYGL